MAKERSEDWNSVENLRRDIRSLANEKKAAFLQRYFKTGPGEYGEGDIFIGVTVPELRKVAKEYRELRLTDIEKLLHSKIHEERHVSLMILVDKSKKASEEERENIVRFYLRNTDQVNNWDLVDLSAPFILGPYVSKREHNRLLSRLASSKNMWERRMSLLASLGMIRNGETRDTLEIAERLLNDKEEIVQKALGWMLREIGNKEMRDEIDFLDKHKREMNRTALRYAIEKFPEKLRLSYLS